MRRTVNYANVTATLALVIALGGTSYAAVKITGHDVVNGSLTGKDVKKHSVPLNRLSGKLPKGSKGDKGDPGAPGPAGTPGAPGPAGTVDASAFVPAAGVYKVTVGPVEWETDSAALFPRTLLGYNRVEFTSTTASGSAVLHLNPTLPGVLAGRGTRLRAAELCWDATAANLVINSAFITATRGSLGATGESEVIGEVADEDAEYHDRTCKRYAIDPGFDLAGGGLVSIRLIVNWQAIGAKIKLAGTTFELERT
jgi:hypothetical protein